MYVSLILYILIRVVNEYPVNRLTVERTEYRLVKLVLGYSVKKYFKQNVANIKIRSVWLFVLRDGTLFWQVINNYRYVFNCPGVL